MKIHLQQLKVNELEQKLKEAQIHNHELEAQKARKGKSIASGKGNIAGDNVWQNEHLDVRTLYQRPRNYNKCCAAGYCVVSRLISELSPLLPRTSRKFYLVECHKKKKMFCPGNAGPDLISSDEEQEISQLRRQVRNLQRDKDKLTADKRKLKAELQGLDHVRNFLLLLFTETRRASGAAQWITCLVVEEPTPLFQKPA